MWIVREGVAKIGKLKIFVSLFKNSRLYDVCNSFVRFCRSAQLVEFAPDRINLTVDSST